MKAFLSKTSYLKGLQCDKAIYLYKKHFKLRDPVSPDKQAKFEKGHRVGELARGLFPGGTLVHVSKGYRYEEAVRTTQALIESGCTSIYEAAFVSDGVLVYADILIKTPEGWHLYEVKSSERIKDVYKDDLALQYYVLKSSGIPITGAGIVHLRQAYDSLQNDIPLDAMFEITDFTGYCLEKYAATKTAIQRMKYICAGNTMPAVSTGPHCTVPYACDFTGFCHRATPSAEEGLFAI